MSETSVPERIRYLLWGKAAGRCQYCNKPIYIDEHTKAEFNSAYIAHIVADKPGGPRGHATESERLRNDISNLMLLCDTHHRLIDRVDIESHPVERLRKMKADHEKRVLIQTEAQDKSSHVLLFGARIGHQDSFLSWKHAHEAMTPVRFPSDTTAIEIGLQNLAMGDDESIYWSTQQRSLNRNFDRMVRQPITDGHIHHLSVFALAPQPLLIELGRLISDLRETHVYQLQREPRQTWQWNHDGDDIDFNVVPATEKRQHVALNISLSATVENSRIQAVLGEDVSIWTLTIQKPHNDFLKSARYLSAFRKTVRGLLEDIKRTHGQDTVLKVFPAMPVAAAVEFGRVWQPKADMEMVIYDQNRNRGGFAEAITIQNKGFM